MKRFPSHKPKQMEFIQQRQKSDCGVACVAMLTGQLYDTILVVFKAMEKSLRGGLYPDDVLEVIEELGFKSIEMKTPPRKGKALVAVQWRDERLPGHYVVWDNRRKQFLDPIHGVFGRNELLKYAKIEGVWKVIRRGS